MAVSAKLSKPTGQRISKIRKQQQKFQFCQSYSYVNRKVWYHQIWIPKNLGFIVSDLTYIHMTVFWCNICFLLKWSFDNKIFRSQKQPTFLSNELLTNMYIILKRYSTEVSNLYQPLKRNGHDQNELVRSKLWFILLENHNLDQIHFGWLWPNYYGHVQINLVT